MPAARGSARTPLGPMPKIVATFVPASSQGQRMHSARTKISILQTFWNKYRPFRDPKVPKGLYYRPLSVNTDPLGNPELVLDLDSFFLSEPSLAWNTSEYQIINPSSFLLKVPFFVPRVLFLYTPIQESQPCSKAKCTNKHSMIEENKSLLEDIEEEIEEIQSKNMIMTMKWTIIK